MTYIPEAVLSDSLSHELSKHLELVHRGKVRDTYNLPGWPDLMLVRASDRISIFDFLLGSLVPGKGAVLTQMTVMWLTSVLPPDTKHHLAAFGAGIDKYLPEPLRKNPFLQNCALVVKRLKMVPVELVYRAYLTGSGWLDYQQSGVVCGHNLPPGLHDGSKLPNPIFTPATKAVEGHDENISANDVKTTYGQELVDLGLHVFNYGAAYASARGILLADTKFEFGYDAEGNWVLADEVLTSDSSRFWAVKDYQKAVLQNRAPQGFDKQYVREWGKKISTPFIGVQGQPIVGINNLNPANPDHQAFVGSLELPFEVIHKTVGLYNQVSDTLEVSV